jgi:hypothetical protein
MHSYKIRQKKNKSGSISIVIVDRANRGYKVVKTIGCAKNEIEKEILLKKAQEELKKLSPTLFDIELYQKSSNNNNQEEEILGKKTSFLTLNNRVYSIGGELIFRKIIADFQCKEYFYKIKSYSKNRVRKIEKRFEYLKGLICLQ